MEPIDFSRRNRNTYDDITERESWGRNELTFNQNTDPFEIIRQAFQEYIVNGVIESNTIGIQIHYIDPGDTEIKTIFLGKQVYNSDSRTFRTNTTGDVHMNVSSINNGSSFENGQLTNLIQSIENFTIVQIAVCEVYNVDPTSTRRRTEIGPPDLSYYPFTIPIKLLFRNVPRFMLRRLRPIARNAPELTNVERRDHIERMFNDTANRDIPVADNETENPNQLKIINIPSFRENITSTSWPGKCMICLDSLPNDENDFCRVNCKFKHVFHGECINMWRNTRLVNPYIQHDWHNECPICREEITAMVNKIKIPEGLSFGRRKKVNKIKELNNDIKYLKNV